jgi:hypothetical protein
MNVSYFLNLIRADELQRMQDWQNDLSSEDDGQSRAKYRPSEHAAMGVHFS